MVKGTSTVVFKQTLLASFIGLCMSQTAFALQEISDEGLSQTTGEGIAFLPENFSMVMQKAENDAAKWDHTDRSLDTGYIRYIPVGPLSNMAPTTAGKADLYLYGLAISKGDNDLNNRLGGVIGSWGTAENPWLFKVQTDSNIPNFGSVSTPSNNCNTTPDACKVTYLALEAPRYHITKPTTVASGADAYDLKLAFWADAFVRDPRQPEKTLDTGASAADVAASTQFNLNGADRANRLRLQAVWDGFSINGSQIQMFQTLGGAVGNASGGYIKDTSYNNTLGMAGVLRFNSGDTRATENGYKATVVRTVNNVNTTSDAVLTNTSTVTIWDGNRYITTTQPVTNVILGSTGAGCDATNSAHRNGEGSCRIRYRKVNYSAPSTYGSWQVTGDTLNKAGVLRFNTREAGSGQGKLDSPAVNGVGAPNFDSTEGLFAYGANINLVLGTLYQPLIVNKDVNSNNLVLEIAAIPNKPDLYKRIYTAYDGFLGGAIKSDYQGSTCSAYACGKNPTATYQGTNATHSSISIGSTVYDPSTGLMTAYKGIDAIGVSFGSLPTTKFERSTAAGNFYKVEASWRTTRSCGFFSNCWNEWDTSWVDLANTSEFSGKSIPCSSGPQCVRWTTSPVAEGTGSPQYLLPANTPNFVQMSNLNDLVPSGNLGSAVIDGMLIQHMKITTKGL